MRDRDEIPVETVEGRRGGGGLADRLVVGLAALALLSGALILAGKGLGGDKGAATTSGSPNSSPDISGRATAGSSPTLSPGEPAVSLEARALPAPWPVAPQPFSGMVRAKVDVPLYSLSQAGANRIGTLKRGSFAVAEEPQELGRDSASWLRINQPEPAGFIKVAGSDALSIERFIPWPTATGGSVMGLVAGAGLFVTWGNLPASRDQASAAFLATSPDGRSWQRVDPTPFRSNQIGSVAYGPAGWIALARVQVSAAQVVDWLWSSQDGKAWRPSGAFPKGNFDSGETRLLGSPTGYLLMNGDYRSRPAIETWHSTDGLTWTRANVPRDLSFTPRQVVATGSGYFAWTDPGMAAEERGAAYSPDGQSWARLPFPPIGPNGQIVAVGDELLAVDTSPVTGAPRVRRGSFSAGSVTWAAQETSLPRSLGVSSLASDGNIAMLFGWDRSSGRTMAWTGTASHWAPVPLPAGAFGGVVPTLAVGSPAGFVALGSRMALRADNPVFWAGRPAGGWAAERSPIVPAVLDDISAPCPPRPTNIGAFQVLDPASAVLCFGDSPMTFRAWTATCQGCSSPSADIYQPEWLAGPDQNLLYLSPVEMNDNWWITVRIADTLAEDPAWVSHWVEVTGHFDDPASKTCRWVPDPHAAATLYSTQSVINQCRQQFVVTRVRVVTGP